MVKQYYRIFTGAQCMDPGQPYLGSQASSDYREGQLVVFSCSERGYTLRPPNPISCGLLQNGTAKFNGSLPVCVGTLPRYTFLILYILKRI